ncbi:MAG: nickel pincer cofactor biosynthesis protein LarC [Planctomycetota bacterium]|nr:nickel pincer cofactor biosynthesis protein LarC [Planctomycetota bacterium]
MKIAYLDCLSGISGDMFLAACVDAGADFEEIRAGIDSLKTGNCKLQKSEVRKFGFRALKVDVIHEPEHAHRHLHHIDKMIDESSITTRQKELAKSIFLKLGKAEAAVHGSSLEKVHFHEVGAIDSIADIVGGAIAWDLMGAERLVCSPIPTGRGQIRIAHGQVSVPAPATVELLKGIPLRSCEIEAELTTPTGAAIVSTLANDFGPLPDMSVETVGVGAGTRDLEEQANVLRILVGAQDTAWASDRVVLLETNLDDVSPELIGFCQDRLREAGALDVFTTSIQMKKSRPGIQLSVIAEPSAAARLKEIIFCETGTLGIRHQLLDRTLLGREPGSVQTDFGKVLGKVVILPDGSRRFTPEFESCKTIALENNVPLEKVDQAARLAWPG